LSVFVLVGLAGYRLRREIRGNAALLATAVAAAALVLLFFAIDTLRNDPGTFVAIVVMLGLAVILDAVWKRSRAHSQASA
jgi:peptidoglycan/LPS O-acetylase OafA/YrhL